MSSKENDELDPVFAEPGKTEDIAELTRLRGALEDSRRQLAEAQIRLEETHASTSWRITRPIRAARTALKRLQARRTRARVVGASEDVGVVAANLDEPAIVRSAREWAAERSVQSRATRDGLGGELESHVKLIAFYLPQFHPIPENDLFWGPGFTDWTNVVRARPLFEGHYQPQLPSELGFYDLRLPEVLERQAELAREYGVHGFCFHYYWFDGHRVLERPLEQLLVGNFELPFCCCWANENWTRRWDGRENEVLLRQRYEGDWGERLIRDLLPVMTDPRYIRVGEAPLLLVYRVDELPDPRRTAELWREVARREAGFELHLAAVQSFEIEDPRPFGFDAAVEFPPHPFSYPAPATKPRKLDREFAGILSDYRAIRRRALDKSLPEYTWYRGVVPAWDNTARRGRRALILLDSSPDAYRAWLRTVALQALCRSRAQEPLVFVNAWNEWGEGTHLEPDDRFGRQWLEATRAGLADGLRDYRAAERRELSEEHTSPRFTAQQ
jgi:lipopolysaccharide biosynthesis protein